MGPERDIPLRKSICVHAAAPNDSGHHYTFEFNNRPLPHWTTDMAIKYVQTLGYTVVKVLYN